MNPNELKAKQFGNDEELKPYTVEELLAMIDESERDSAAGRVFDADEVFNSVLSQLEQKDEFCRYQNRIAV